MHFARPVACMLCENSMVYMDWTGTAFSVGTSSRYAYVEVSFFMLKA